jgi:hypothetical protein
MHNILFSKPKITPVATCSSDSGLRYSHNNVESQQTTATQETDYDIITEAEGCVSSIKRKRKNKQNAADERHQAELAGKNFGTVSRQHYCAKREADLFVIEFIVLLLPI